MGKGDNNADDNRNTDGNFSKIQIEEWNEDGINTISFLGEVKAAFRLAFPVVVSFLCQMSLIMTTSMMLGHVSNEYLAAVGIGSLTMNVSGFALLQGMSTGLETLGSQAFGAQSYRLCGVLFQRCMLIVTCTCCLVAMVWLFAPQLLRMARVECPSPDLIGEFIRTSIFGLWPNAMFICMQKYLQIQGVMWPTANVLVLGNIVHALVSYLFIFQLDMGLRGAGIALSITYWCLCISLFAYIRFYGLHKKTWFGWSKECFSNIGTYMKLTVPGTGMICMEWWGFELTTLLCTQFGDAAVATQTVLIQTTSFCFMIPSGLGVAVCTRVGTLLGANRPHLANKAAKVSIFLVSALMIAVSILVVILRKQVAQIFGAEGEVMEKVTTILPIVMLLVLADGIQGVSTGIVRASGRQAIGAALNLTAYWVVGVPVGCLLAFFNQMELLGIWLGIACGLAFQMSCLLVMLFCFTDWSKIAQQAQDRALAEESKVKSQTSTEMQCLEEADDKTLIKQSSENIA